MDIKEGLECVCCFEGTLVKAVVLLVYKHTVIVSIDNFQVIINKSNIIQSITPEVSEWINLQKR